MTDTLYILLWLALYAAFAGYWIGEAHGWLPARDDLARGVFLAGNLGMMILTMR